MKVWFWVCLVKKSMVFIGHVVVDSKICGLFTQTTVAIFLISMVCSIEE